MTATVTSRRPLTIAAVESFDSNGGGLLAFGAGGGRTVVVDDAGGVLLDIDSGLQSAALVSLSPDGEWLAVADSVSYSLISVPRRSIVIRAGATPLASVRQVSRPAGLAVTPDADRLLLSTEEHRVEVGLHAGDWLALACELAGRDLTEEEWDQYVGLDPFEVTCG